MASRFERQGQKELNEKHTQILKQLMARSENRKCADCRKKGFDIFNQDPRWASWNIGIFVCIQCSGVHRSIGTHVSKVKSADLDTWNPDQNMVKWGNLKANLYWEHEWPKDMQPSDRNMDQFIRAKYERKQYAMKGEIPDPSTLGSIESPVFAKSGPPAAVIPNSSQQLFNAFGNSAPHLTQNLVQSAPASASQQLFDAFSSPSPPSQQSQKNVKDSILSLYGKQQQKSNLQQNTATFVEFAAFQESSNDRKPKPFDPFESIEGQSGANTNSKYGVFDSAAKPQPATQRNPAIFGTTVFTSQPSSPTKIASFVPQQNTSNSVGLQAVSSPIVSPSKEIFDAFASIPENESGQLTGISSDFGLLNVQPSLTNNENKVNARTQPLDDFGDFAQSSLPVADFQPFNQSKPLTAGPAAQDGWAGWGDQGKGNNFPQGPIVTNSALSTSPMQNMPASSRNTSNILEQLDLSPKKPMSFDTLPPVEDGWSGFQ